MKDHERPAVKERPYVPILTGSTPAEFEGSIYKRSWQSTARNFATSSGADFTITRRSRLPFRRSPPHQPRSQKVPTKFPMEMRKYAISRMFSLVLANGRFTGIMMRRALDFTRNSATDKGLSGHFDKLGVIGSSPIAPTKSKGRCHMWLRPLLFFSTPSISGKL